MNVCGVLIAINIAFVGLPDAASSETLLSRADADSSDILRSPHDPGLFYPSNNFCGWVATYIACHNLGHPVELANIIDELPITSRGNSMEQLVRFFDARGMRATGFHLSAAALAKVRESADAPQSAIALINGRHWVFVQMRDKSAVHVYEYPQWKVLRLEDFEAVFDGKVIIIRGSRLDSLSVHQSLRIVAAEVALLLVGITLVFRRQTASS